MRGQGRALGVIAVLLLSAFFAIPFAFLSVAYAQTSGTVDANGCASLGGTWSDSTSTCNDPNRILIVQNASLVVPSGVTLVARSITDYGSLGVRGSLFNDNGTLDDYGLVDVYGTLYNNGTVNIYSGAGVTVEGSLINDAGGRMEVSGTFNNAGGTVQNDGTFYDYPGGSLDNYGTFWNGGFIANHGNIFNLGTINTYNFIINEATMDNAGTVDNTGNIQNYGTITNECDALFTNESGSSYSGNDPMAVQCSSTTSESTTSMSSAGNFTSSSSSSGGNLTGGSSSDMGGNATNYSGDVPEFPFTAIPGFALTLMIVFAYMAIRRQSQS